MLSDLGQTLQNRRKLWKGKKEGRKGAVKNSFGYNKIFGLSTGTDKNDENRVINQGSSGGSLVREHVNQD